MYTLLLSADEYSELPTPPVHNQTLVNQSHELSLQPNSSFQKGNNHKQCTISDQSDEECSQRKEQDYEIP